MNLYTRGSWSWLSWKSPGFIYSIILWGSNPLFWCANLGFIASSNDLILTLCSVFRIGFKSSYWCGC